jgi:ubiquinone/menaquinone biosynthesis C-methylase UbiE
MLEWYRESFDELYSDIYSHRDDEEAARVVELLGRLVRLPGTAVLDVACGQGRHLRALSRAGARGHGIDLSDALLKRREDTARPCPGVCVRGDMRRLPFRDGSFDTCTSMFTSLGYFGKTEDEVTVLKEMARVLKPRGHCFVDHGNLTWLKRHLEPRTVKTKGRFTILETRAFLEDGRTVEKNISLHPAGIRARAVSEARPLRTYRERVTFFTLRELGSLLTRAGFGVVRAFGDYDGSTFDERSSPRLLMLARRLR